MAKHDGIFPFSLTLPTLALVNSVARLALADDFVIREVSGSLRSITLGTFSVDVRVFPGNTLITSLSWTAAGLQRVKSLDHAVFADEIIDCSVTSLGTAPLDCVITLWWQK